MAETTDGWVKRISSKLRDYGATVGRGARGAVEGAMEAAKNNGNMVTGAIEGAQSNPALRSTPPVVEGIGDTPERMAQVDADRAAYKQRLGGNVTMAQPQQVIQNPNGSASFRPRGAPANPGLAPTHPLNVMARPGDPAVFGGGGAGRPPVPPVPPAAATPPPVPPTGGQKVVEEVVKKTPSRIAGAVSKIGPAAAGVAEFMDPNVRATIDPTSNLSMTDRLKQVSRSALRVGGGMLGTVGGAAMGGGLMSVPLGMTGGYGGYKAGDMVADWMFGPQAGARNAPTKPAANGTAAAPSPASAAPGYPSGDGFQGLRGAAKENANDFIDGVDNILPVPKQGEGFMRNNETGAVYHRQPGVGNTAYPGLRGDAQSGGNADDELAPFRELARKGGVHAMGALGAYGGLSRMKAVDRQQGLRQAQIQATSDTANARLAYDMANNERTYQTGRSDHAEAVETQNRTTNEKAIETAAAAMAEPQKTSNMPGMGEKDADYKSRLSKLNSELSDQINFTLGDRKSGPKRLGQLSGDQVQQMLMGRKMKDKIEAARASGSQWVTDYFGSKRSDSKNLDSYMPAGVEGSIVPFSGGIRVKTMNGNTMTLSSALGGGFNLTGPNDPADADIMALLQKPLDAYRKKNEGK